MRILFLVLLTIVALVGIGLGGAGAWSYTIGPNRDKIAEVTKTAQEAEALGVLMGKTELAKGQDVGSAADIMRQGLRGYRVMQVGGAAIALLNIVLIVLAVRRRSKAILIVGGIAVGAGLTCFIATPPRALDFTMYGINVAVAGSAAASALFAWLADWAARRRAGAVARPAMAQL
jgi:hypothetical protein